MKERIFNINPDPCMGRETSSQTLYGLRTMMMTLMNRLFEYWTRWVLIDLIGQHSVFFQQIVSRLRFWID